MGTDWDCIVVGGGAAGLSAALVLGRARRRTLVVDAGRQSNLAAHGIGGLLGSDGMSPAQFYAEARGELAAYPSIELREGEVAGGERTGDGFELELADGSRETARRVVLATGMDYRYRDLPGLAERWGGSVFHCPFCHGWEARERPLGVLDRGATGVHRALLLTSWSDEVTLLTDGPAELEADEAARLRAAGVAVDERPVAGVRGPGTEVEAVVFEDGSEHACGGVLVGVTLHQRSPLAMELGAELGEPNQLVKERLEVDSTFATTVPGLYAAGDAGPSMQSVAAAVASGQVAAAMVVQSLAAERAAVVAD